MFHNYAVITLGPYTATILTPNSSEPGSFSLRLDEKKRYESSILNDVDFRGVVATADDFVSALNLFESKSGSVEFEETAYGVNVILFVDVLCRRRRFVVPCFEVETESSSNSCSILQLEEKNVELRASIEMLQKRVDHLSCPREVAVHIPDLQNGWLTETHKLFALKDLASGTVRFHGRIKKDPGVGFKSEDELIFSLPKEFSPYISSCSIDFVVVSFRGESRKPFPECVFVESDGSVKWRRMSIGDPTAWISLDAIFFETQDFLGGDEESEEEV